MLRWKVEGAGKLVAPSFAGKGRADNLWQHSCFELFLKGAREFLKTAKSVNAKSAILRTPSPSCGFGRTWRLDDSFANHVAEGDGVTAALLKKNGIEVITGNDEDGKG